MRRTSVDQLREVVIGDRVGRDAAERDLRDVRDRRQLGRDAGQELAGLEADAGREVVGEVQPIGAEGVDGAAGRDDGDAGKAHALAPAMDPSAVVSAACQCGAAAGGVYRATRVMSRLIRSPSTGPSA